MSKSYLWQDIRTFIGSQEKFFDRCEPYFCTSSSMGIVDILQKLCALTLMQYIVEEIKDYLNSIVNYWPVTMIALVLYEASACGICGRKSGIGTSFSLHQPNILSANDSSSK